MLEIVDTRLELERIGLPFQLAGNSEIRVSCPNPNHEDSSPSCSINIEKNTFYCQGCKAKGDIATFISLFLGQPRDIIFKDLTERYGIEVTPHFDPLDNEEFHKKIWNSKKFLKELRHRGITDEMIKSARLGVDGGRITIPVYDAHRNIINIRKYLPGAPGKQKMRNTRGMKSLALYQIEQVKYDKIVIFGGEMKALVAGHYLNKFGIGAVSSAGGEGTWAPTWTSLFSNKEVYICMDIDLAGKIACQKLIAFLKNSTKKISILKIPLDSIKFPKGDINDWVRVQNPSLDDWKELVDSSKEADLKPLDVQGLPSEVYDVTVHTARLPKYVRRRLSFRGIVSAVQENSYLLPKEVLIRCSRDNGNCALCPVYASNAEDTSHVGVSLEIPSHSEGLLSISGCPQKLMSEQIKNTLGIPSCKKSAVDIKTYRSAFEARISPEISISSEAASSSISQPALILSDKIALNDPYIFEAVLYPDPATQEATLLVTNVEASETQLTDFDLGDIDSEELSIFQPEEWTEKAIRQKLLEIYNDFEANVTRIFCRKQLHILIDLTYHSALTFKFRGREVPGWINSLIIGDTAQGKSETTLRLQEHYGLGDRIDCKNASAAGLIGGVQQFQGKWFITWGAFPNADRRLLILEEVKGASTEVLGRLTDVRSSGVAEIGKIDRRKTNARTRCIWISNPRTNRSISTYSYGILAIQELVGALEDVRRFDFACIVSPEQINSETVNNLSINCPEVEHKYTHELCQKLLLFAWTLKSDDIEFEEEAIGEILKESIKLCDKYSDSFPLIDAGTIRYKVAKLSVAVAIRTFSENKGKILVRSCHVKFILSFLQKIYDDPCFGYKEFSELRKNVFQISEEDCAAIKNYLSKFKFAASFVKQSLRQEYFLTNDVRDFLQVDDDLARDVLSFLVRYNCFHRQKNGYVKTPTFIEILKDLRSSNLEDSELAEEEDF